VGHPPQQMCPPEAVPWAVRVALCVAVAMVDAVDRHPLQRASLVGEGTQGGQKVFHEPGRLKAPMGEQAVVTHRYAKSRGQVEDQADQQGRPRKGERGQYDACLNQAPPQNVRPIEPGPAGTAPAPGKRLRANE
jgi:hypothetical protein